MTLVPASSLSRAELHMLGVNVVSAVREDRRHDLAAVNRSLDIHGEAVDELHTTPEITVAGDRQAVA